MGNLKETQIDHVVVSNFGIFSVETKNYRGWIFGNENQKYWTQVIYHYKKQFYNPAWQNYAHIKSLELALTNKLKSPIIGLVVFPTSNKIEVSGNGFVGNANDLIEKIKSYTTNIYLDAERDEIYNVLIASNIQDVDIRNQHNMRVRDLKSGAV